MTYAVPYSQDFLDRNKNMLKEEGLTTNILDYKQSTDIIEKSLNEITTSVGSSLGPFGLNTMVGDPLKGTYFTKDGYTILTNIKYANPGEAKVLQTIKQISFLQMSKVGDGTTSAIIIANTLYNSLKDLRTKHTTPTHKLLSILNEIKDEISETIMNEISKPTVTVDDIKNVATISANNDVEIGDVIGKIYEELGNGVTLMGTKSIGKDTHYESKEGYVADMGYLHPVFITNIKKKTVEFDEPLIIMYDGTFSGADTKFIYNIINDQTEPDGGLRKPIIFIANGFAHDFTNDFLMHNKNINPNLPIAAIRMSTATPNYKEIFEDLAIYLNAVPLRSITNNKNLSWSSNRFGTCRKIVITNKQARFIDGDYEQKVMDERLYLIQDEIDRIVNRTDKEVDYTEVLGNLKERYKKLHGKVAIIYIGGDTTEDKTAREYLVEDAALATRAAVKSGIVPGGNLSMIKALTILIDKCKNDGNELLNDILNRLLVAFTTPYKMMLENSGAYDITIDHVENDNIIGVAPVKNKLLARIDEIKKMYIEKNIVYNMVTEQYEDKDWSVINPTLTELVILESAFSIIGLLLTTGQILIDTPSIVR